MHGWIIYNGQLNSEKIYELVIWLQKTGQKYGVELTPVKNNELIILFDKQSKPLLQHIQGLALPDFVISWDKDIPLARQFELLGIRVYNHAQGIHVCDHKGLMVEAFAKSGIRIPKTILAPMVYSNSHIRDTSLYDAIIRTLGLPMIIKEVYGSFGQQVYMVNTKEELVDCVQALGPKHHLFQEYIQSSHGKDIRINIVNQEYITAMKRVSDSDFRANITAGGKAVAYTPTAAEIALALKSTELLNLDFAGVDLLFGEDGPVLCEVNGNPHFKSIYECTGIDISEHIIKYIIEDQR